MEELINVLVKHRISFTFKNDGLQDTITAFDGDLIIEVTDNNIYIHYDLCREDYGVTDQEIEEALESLKLIIKIELKLTNLIRQWNNSQ